MNEGELSGVLGLPGWPAVAEEAIIARDVLLAEHVGSRLHVCHVSTAGSVELIRWAKARGVDVTAEVTPHHLLLTDDLVDALRPDLQGEPAAAHRRPTSRRCAPGWPTARSTPSPPTTRRTRARTRTASGRRPRSACSASRPRCRCVAADDGRDRPARLGRRRRPDVRAARRASAGWPATAGRSPSGEPANLVLVDPAARWTVDPRALASQVSRNTPVRRARAARRGSSRRSCAAGRRCSTAKLA